MLPQLARAVFVSFWHLGQSLPAWAGLLLGLHLVERRGRSQRLEPGRQVELATLLDSIPDAVFLFDNGGKIVDANQVAEQLCAHSREQLRGRSIDELNALLAAQDEFDRPVDHFSMGVNRALAGDLVRNLRRLFHNPADGRAIEAFTSASPIREADGQISGAILSVRDVTELVQLQRRLADTQRHKELGQMAAGLAHDFSNVLDAILQAATLLDGARRTDERRRYTEMIRNAAGRGAEIIERVREYLRTGTGQRTSVDARRLLRETIELARPLWCRKPTYKVRVDLHPLPMVEANAADLRRVFTNLIVNALEAMPEGGELCIACELAGDAVRISVADTGVGMSPDEQKRAFVPYYTTKPQGTGLGLSGAQRIIHALGGQISVSSEVRKGTRFVIELPVLHPAQQDAGSPS